MLPPFERTTCDCAECRQCCTRPAHLTPDDPERIATHLGVAVDALLPMLAAGRGALVYNTHTRQFIRVPTLVPRTVGGRCIFLTADERCAIHPVAPFGCAHFDMHMSAEEAAPRSAWGLRRIMESSEYGQLLARVRAEETPDAQE